MKVDQFKILEELGWKFTSFEYYDNEDKPERVCASYEFTNKHIEVEITVNVYKDNEINFQFESHESYDMALIKELASIDWVVL